jgi:ABC-type branched-subunit amino acid transport system ATPase component
LAPLLEVRGLSRTFGGLQALQAIDLVVDPGEIVGMIGPNGSGKTTFFNALTGLFQATAGSVRFKDKDITRLPPHRITAAGLARTFQNQRLFNQMSVLENVLVGMHCRTRSGLAGIVLGTPGTRAEQERSRARAMEILGFFRERLVPRADRPAYSLSYANRRRLEITRAMATEPAMILLDEPAAGMNPAETRELMGDIVRLKERGFTILLIEHDMGLVRGVCSRVVALDHGVKIAEGDFATVHDHPAVLEAYLGKRAAHA